MNRKDFWSLKVGDKVWHLGKIRNEESPVATTFNYEIKACKVILAPYQHDEYVLINLPGEFSFRIPVGDQRVARSAIFLSKEEAIEQAEHLRSEQTKMLKEKVEEFASFYKKAIDSITIKVKK